MGQVGLVWSTNPICKDSPPPTVCPGGSISARIDSPWWFHPTKYWKIFPNLNISKVSYHLDSLSSRFLVNLGEPSERENSSKSWISRDCSEKDMKWKIGTHQNSIGVPQIKFFCQGGIWEFLIFRQFFEMIFRQFFEMNVFLANHIYHHCQSFLSLNVQIMVEVGG